MTSETHRNRPYPSVSPARPSARDRFAGSGWELAIFGDLTDKQADLMGQLLDVPPRSKGTIFFDSCGGSAYVGLALASLIRLRGLKATGVVAGECSSAALLPFAACCDRYVTPHSTLLFHPVRWQSDDNVRLDEAAEWARHFRIMEEDMDALQSRLFRMDAEAMSRWTRPGRFVTGIEFADAGLARLVNLFDGDVWTQIRKLESGKPKGEGGNLPRG